jgi:hypothetical protein
MLASRKTYQKLSSNGIDLVELRRAACRAPKPVDALVWIESTL